MEAIASRLEAIATRVGAIATGVTAIAIGVEAIATRVEAIAIRLEATATRVEANAILLGDLFARVALCRCQVPTLRARTQRPCREHQLLRAGTLSLKRIHQ